MADKIKVDPKLQGMIPALTKDEYSQLECNIRTHGCRDALVTWAEKGTLLDGHNRLAICVKHGIKYGTVAVSLPDEAAAEDWIINNQLGRRNLTRDQWQYLVGLKYNRTKKPVTDGGKGTAKGSVDQNDPRFTADLIAKQHGISAATVKRAGKMAEMLDADKPAKDAVMSGKRKISDVIRENKRAEMVAKLESVEVVEAKKASGLYDVIVMDPPWPIEKIERDCRPNQVKLDYPTMSLDDIKHMEIPHAKDCHIWIWCTHRFMPAVFDMMNRNELIYVCTFVWHKPGGFQPIGLPQYNCEFAVYCRFGKPKFTDTKAFNTCFSAPRGAHSEKPGEFYKTVRRVTAGRRLDMFNRRKIEGFDGWGKEAK